jgi:site-specific DNA recombinase
MTPTHTTKNATKRYRYYVCSSAQKHGWHTCSSKSIPAGEIEQFVVEQIKCIGKDPSLISETIVQASNQERARVAELEAERHGVERALAHLDAEVRRLVTQITPGESDTPGVARLADLQERIRNADQRATEIREQVIGIRRRLVDEREVALALSIFDPVWGALTPREQTHVVQLLVEQVEYDGGKGKVSITFHAAGIKTLADELASRNEEKTP